MKNRIRIARGVSEKRKASTEKLVKGQLFLETDTQVLYNTSTDVERELRNATPINVAGNAKLGTTIGTTDTTDRQSDHIFEENSNTVKNSTNVTNKINDKNIDDIFEEDGTTTKISTSSKYNLEENLILKEGTINNLTSNFSIGMFPDNERSEDSWYLGLDLSNINPMIKTSGAISKGTEIIRYGSNTNKITYLKWTGDLILSLDSNSSAISPSKAWNNIVIKLPHINFQGKDYSNTALGVLTDSSYVFRPGTYYISTWGNIDLWTGNFGGSVYSFKGVWFPVDYNSISSSSYGAAGGMQSYNPDPITSTMNSNTTYFIKISNLSICFIQDRELL